MKTNQIELLLAAEAVGDLTFDEKRQLEELLKTTEKRSCDIRLALAITYREVLAAYQRESKRMLAPERLAAILGIGKAKRAGTLTVRSGEIACGIRSKTTILHSNRGDACRDAEVVQQVSGTKTVSISNKVTVLECNMRAATSVSRAVRILFGDEAKAGALLHDAATAYHYLNTDGCVTWANRRQLDLWGYDDAQQVRGRPLWEMVREDEELSVRNYVVQTLAGSRAEPLYCTYRCAGGDTRPVGIHGLLIREASKKESRGILSTVEDLRIWNKCRTMQLPHDSAYLDALEHSPICFFRKDRRHIYTWANQAFCRELKSDIEQIIGQDDYMFFPPEDALKYQKDDDWVMKTRLPLETVERHLAPHNAVLYVHCLKTPIADKRDKVIGVDCKYWNAENGERALHLLREAKYQAEERYRRAFDDAPIGIYQSTVDGRFLHANLACAHALGFKTVEEMLTSTRDIASDLYVNPADRATLIHHLARKPWEVRNRKSQLYRRRRDGSRETIWIIESAHAILDVSENITYIEGYIQDIAEFSQPC